MVLNAFALFLRFSTALSIVLGMKGRTSLKSGETERTETSIPFAFAIAHL